jgi:hypothetical protein
MAEAVTTELIASLTKVAETNSSVVKELSNLTKELKKILVGTKAAAVKVAAPVVAPVKTEQEKSATDVALEQKEPTSVVIEDIKPDAYKKLEKLFESLTGKEKKLEPGNAQKRKSTGSKGILGDLLDSFKIKDLLTKSNFGKALSAGLIQSVGGLGASLALAIGSWFNDGPWKGTMKLVGEIGTKIFIPKVTKIMTQFFPKLFETFTKGIQSIGSTAGGLITKLLPTTGVLGKLATKFLGFFTPLLKRLPIIGTIINIGSAISRFIQGDIIGGLIDIGSAIAVLVPGVGTAISLALGLLNAGRDLTGESKKSTGEQVANIGSILGKAVDWIKGKIKNLFNYYFGKISRGIDQIKSGDYIRGIITLASFVPTLWWMETVYNWLAGPPPVKPEEEGKKETLPSDVVGKAYDWVKGKLKKIFTSWFSKFSRGWELIKSGNYFQGIVVWASTVPGFGWLSTLYDWVTGTDSMPTDQQEGAQQEKFDWGKIFTAIVDSIKKKLKSALSLLKKHPFIPDSLVDKISSYLGIDDSKEGEKAEAPPPAAVETAIAPEQTAPDVKSTPQQITPIEQPVAQVNIPAQLTPEQQATQVNIPAQLTPEQQAIKDQRETAKRAQEAFNKLDTLEQPQVPLPVTPPPPSNEKLINKISDLINTTTAKEPAKGGSFMSSNAVATADNSSINVYNQGGDRDIPYVERNKYRQQLLYIRGIL